MLFPGFGVRSQSLRGAEGFGVLCVRLASSQPDADGPANALTGQGSLDPAKAVVFAGSKDAYKHRSIAARMWDTGGDVARDFPLNTSIYSVFFLF